MDLYLQLPIYLRINIMIFCDHQTFINLVKAYKEKEFITSNEIIAVHGNLVERLFHERCLLWYPKQIKYKEVEVWTSWKTFYHEVLNVRSNFDSKTLYINLINNRLDKLRLVEDLITSEYKKFLLTPARALPYVKKEILEFLLALPEK